MRKRDLVLWVIVSIVTFGIGGIVWFAKITNDVNFLSKQQDKANTPLVPEEERYTTSWIAAAFFMIITFGLYGLYWAFKTSRAVFLAKKANGLVDSTDYSVINLILWFLGLGIVIQVILQNELNELSDIA